MDMYYLSVILGDHSVGSFTDMYYLSVILGDLEDLIWYDLVTEVAESGILRSTSYAVWTLSLKTTFSSDLGILR